MSDDVRARAIEVEGVAVEVTCDHYWAWVSPAGTTLAARLCQFCHAPDAEWLNTTEAEVRERVRAQVEDELASPREFDEWTDGWNAARAAVLALLAG